MPVSFREGTVSCFKKSHQSDQSMFNKKSHQQISPPSFLDPRAQAHPIQDGFHILWALRPWGLRLWLGCWGDPLPAGMPYFYLRDHGKELDISPWFWGSTQNTSKPLFDSFDKWLVLLKFLNSSSFSWISLSIENLQDPPRRLRAHRVPSHPHKSSRRFMVETKKGNGCGRSKPFGFLSFGPKTNMPRWTLEIFGAVRVWPNKEKTYEMQGVLFQVFQNI